MENQIKAEIHDDDYYSIVTGFEFDHERGQWDFEELETNARVRVEKRARAEAGA